MVLTTEGELSIADLAWRVEKMDAIVRVPRHGLYLESDAKGFLDLGMRNAEEWASRRPHYVYTKACEWKIRTTPAGGPLDPAATGHVRGAKYLDDDEFAHWTKPRVVRHQPRNSASGASGRYATPSRRAPCCPASTDHRARGVHIVDHVTRTTGCRTSRVPSTSADARLHGKPARCRLGRVRIGSHRRIHRRTSRPSGSTTAKVRPTARRARRYPHPALQIADRDTEGGREGLERKVNT